MKNLRLISILVAGVCALAALVLIVRGCRKAAPPPAPPKPLSAAERTRASINERMADPAYTNGLAMLATRQRELARLRNDVRVEFKVWREGFLASNEEARATLGQIQALERNGASPTNAAIAALSARLDELMAADPAGRRLIEKRDAVEEALKEHQGVIHDFIGARVRKQRLEHLGEDAAIAAEYRRKLIEEGKVRPYTPRPAPTNMPPPRTKGWWTNQPPVAAGSPVRKVGKSESLESPAATPGTRNPAPGTK